MMQEFVQRVKDLSTEVVNGIHTAIPGKIVSFDPATSQAVVTPTMLYRKPDGSTIPYPDVAGVPVYFPQGNTQQVSISYAVKPGDGCLLISAEQALDYWMYGMETDSDIRFDLTNSIAIVGLFVSPSPGIQKACDENAVVVMAGGVALTVKPERVEIDGDLQVNGKINATEIIKSDIDVLVLSREVSLANHTHGGPKPL